MTFTVEDGTGLSSSNSYLSVADADAYFDLRDRSEWTGTNDEKETALIKATDYIDNRWGHLMLGSVLKTDQALEFPRTGFTGIPTRLEQACAEYAVRALTNSLMPDPDFDSTNKDIIEKSEGLGKGALTESVRYASAQPRQFRRYPVPDGLMRSFVRSGGRVIR